MAIEIRELRVKDVFTVARMLSKITKGAQAELASALSGKKSDPTKLGLILTQSIFTEAEGDLRAWLADLTGMSEGEFENMPAVTILEVLEGLFQKEDMRDFFTKASSLATRLTDSA